jgi:hypothetical protein
VVLSGCLLGPISVRDVYGAALVPLCVCRRTSFPAGRYSAVGEVGTLVVLAARVYVCTYVYVYSLILVKRWWQQSHVSETVLCTYLMLTAGGGRQCVAGGWPRRQRPRGS